jgi:hypothetical protein
MLEDPDEDEHDAEQDREDRRSAGAPYRDPDLLGSIRWPSRNSATG